MQRKEKRTSKQNAKALRRSIRKFGDPRGEKAARLKEVAPKSR